MTPKSALPGTAEVTQEEPQLRSRPDFLICQMRVMMVKAHPSDCWEKEKNEIALHKLLSLDTNCIEMLL